MPEKLNNTIQENLISLLCFNDEVGKLVSNLIDPNLFEGEYRVIAERAVTYWQRHGEAPKLHTADLVSDVLDDPQNRKAQTYRRILSSMMSLSEGMNTTYVLEQLRTFTRMQKLKDAILKSAERLNSQQETAISEVEDMWNDLLRAREVGFDPGMRLTDIDRILSYLQTQYAEFQTGIPQLDRRNIVPYRGALMLLLGGPGAGKSWWLINLGKNALLHRKKVLHISLEMPEDEVGQRYHQSLWSAPKREGPVEITGFEFDKDDKLSGFTSEKVIPDFTFDSDAIREELESHMGHFGERFDNLIIKRFPPRYLTPNMLRGYLDNLETAEKFIPDLLIMDYPALMKVDERNYRISMGRIIEEVRAVAVERNMAVCGVHQISKEGANAIQVGSKHVSEDWSIIATADMIATLSKTDSEARHGLARLYVSKARAEEDKFGVLITQNFKLGQFVLDSAFLDPGYFEHLKELEEEGSDDGEEDDDS